MPQTVVYFVDYFANYHDPDIARAFVSILEHHDITVHVPPRQTHSGMSLISMGDLDAARELAEHNVRELANFAREGYPIVCTEPSAVVALRDEYPMLLEHPDAHTVAAQVVEAGQFLKTLHEHGALKTDLQPLRMSVSYHTPCHLKSLYRDAPLAELMSLIPEFELLKIDKGCSGMAGLFGLSQRNYETSVEIGKPLMMTVQETPCRAAMSECASCRMQMTHQTQLPAVHPLEVLAYAYGLLPALEKQLGPVVAGRKS